MKNKENNKSGFAFLGNDFKGFIRILIFIVFVLIAQKVLDYKYLVVQKKVQEGNLDLWHDFLLIAVFSAILLVVGHLANVFAQLWIERVQKFNAFKRYDGIIQQEGKLKPFLKMFEFANSKVNSIMECITAIISIVYTLVMMQIVNFTVPQYIGAGFVFCLGVSFGIVRGILQQKADSCRSDIGARQQLLSNFFMPSANILDERLKEMNQKYWRNMRLQIVKNFFKVLPDLVRALVFLAFMWDVVKTFDYSGEETVYSYSSIIATAYAYIVSVANDIGNILESFSKIYKYSKDKDILFLDDVENERDKTIIEQSKNVTLDEKGISINKSFTASLSKKDKTIAHYYLPDNLRIQKGKIIMLDGDNGVGKSRLTQLLNDIVQDTLWYNPKSSMSDIFIENFKCQGLKINYEEIINISSELNLERVPKREEQMEDLEFKEPLNGADRQLLIALQILYFAKLEHKKNPNKLQLIILDEILGNVAPENVPKIIHYISEEVKKIGACMIFITHSHKSCVYDYVEEIWQMGDEGRKIKIESLKPETVKQQSE